MEKLLLAKKLLLLLLLSSSFSSFCFAQVTQEWVVRNPGPGTFDGTRSLALDQDGNVYVTGSGTGEGTGSDYSTIKYNAAGVQQWEARYNGPGNNDDDAFAITVDNNGNAYVTGRSTGIETELDFATIKYNSAGVQQWVARYNGSENGLDWAKSIAVDAEGNVYVTGESGRGQGTSSDYATIKYNSNGIEQWVARYDGSRNDAANALALDEAGNVYVTGRSPLGVDLDEEDADYTTIKYDNNGNELWIKRYDGPATGNHFDEALAITTDGSGNVYVTGRSSDQGAEDAVDYATVKYDTNGNELWSARYNGPGNSIDNALALAVDASQNVYVTGFSAAEPEETNYDYATIKYNATGNEVWVRRYNGPANANDQATSLALDATGNVYVTGRSTGTGTAYDFATIKYNTAGVEQWVARYNGPANGDDGTGIFIGFFTAHPIAVDSLFNVYVTGLSTGIGTGFDYTTIKYSQTLTACGNNNDKVLICHKGKRTLCISNSDVADHIAHGDQLGACSGNVVSIAREITEPAGLTRALPARFRMFNAPNPVAAITSIYYELPFDGYVSLQVYDMLGREIATLVNGSRKAGYHSICFNASALPKGVYNYRITVKTKTTIWTQTNKFSVLN